VHFGLFRGRANIHGGKDRNYRKKKRAARAERRRLRREKARKRSPSQFPTGYPIPAVPLEARAVGYRGVCSSRLPDNRICGYSWEADREEAFCPQCGGSVISWEQVLVKVPLEGAPQPLN